MHVQVHYQNLDNTPWMDQFIESRVAKLNRYLSDSARIQVNLRYEKNNSYATSLAIHNPHHDYVFSTVGENLYESISLAIDKARRALSEQKQRMKDNINRKLFPINDEEAP